MRLRYSITKISTVFALVVLATTGAIWEVRRVRAAVPNSNPPTFGIVHIVSGQAVRLNIVCLQHGVNGIPLTLAAGRSCSTTPLGTIIKRLRTRSGPATQCLWSKASRRAASARFT